MSWYRWLFCGLCLVVVDGAWLYPLLGFMGFVAGLGHAPVSLAALEGVLLVAAGTAALGSILPSAWAGARMSKPVLATVCVWLGVFVCAERAGLDASLAWPAELLMLRHSLSGSTALLTIAGVLAWCWWHANRRMHVGAGAPVIARSFRLGLVIMVSVLAFEALGRLDLGTRASLLPFFAASLMGMAMARAPVHGSRARAWLVLTGGAVSVVLIAGVALGVVLVVAVRGGLGALWSLWLRLATAATESVSATLHALLGDAGGDTGLVLQAPSMEPPDWFVMAVLLLGAALMGALAHRLLHAPRKEIPRVSLDLGEEAREALHASDTPFLDKWAQGIARSWLHARRAGRRAAGAPRRSEIQAIQQVYQQLLALARRRDIPINPAHTPFQRARSLSRELPGIPVDDITRRFVLARYGGEAPPADVVRSLADALDGN